MRNFTAGEVKEESLLFLKKKKQKDFSFGASGKTPAIGSIVDVAEK